MVAVLAGSPSEDFTFASVNLYSLPESQPHAHVSDDGPCQMSAPRRACCKATLPQLYLRDLLLFCARKGTLEELRAVLPFVRRSRRARVCGSDGVVREDTRERS